MATLNDLSEILKWILGLQALWFVFWMMARLEDNLK